MAKIICISKYPPLEGGIAAKTYWLTKALGDRGHEVHVVTDRLDVAPEYSHPMEALEPALKNVFVHRPRGDIPWHIPDDKHRVFDLLSVAIEVTNAIHPDVIDTGYLVPYGIVGHLASQATGIPFVVRHGGSDLVKFMQAGVWRALFEEALSAAAMVITDRMHAPIFKSYRTSLIPPYVPDTTFFNPKDRKQGDKPILAIIGKANYHWRHKGWHKMAGILDLLGSEFQYLIVSQGNGLADFRKFIEESGVGEDIEWETFIPPWEMPDLLKRIDGLIVFGGDLPFPAFSNLVLEGLYSGTIVITDGTTDLMESYKKENVKVSDLPGEVLPEVLPIAANKPNLAITQIVDYFEKRNSSYVLHSLSDGDYQKYITANENVLLGRSTQESLISDTGWY